MCADGKTTMHVHEKKASIRQFYGENLGKMSKWYEVMWTAVIFPSIMQLQSGLTDLEERKQKETFLRMYSRKDGLEKGKLSDSDVEREAECGICLETNRKVVLPNCSHSLCLKHGRSQSCPFCRESLKGVKLSDLWICVEADDLIDTAIISKENSKRLFMYIEKLPLVTDAMLNSADSHLR
ncbi:hypothetical protein OSB04_023501 [Centaurea solstitialis]|uniref:RING-type domain-containing protein n=1 Tax=Centaurea solstitialis TaxID=347529 RepID=A0AA38SJA9_9ASTR|nr:hypothetical protein OSB04_023501 [Centaurea solstitialis]